MYESNANIQLTINNKIATITFFHQASNSFTSQMLTDLTNQFYSLNDNNLVNVIVLQSKGDGAFCAGASFTELMQIENIEHGTQFFSGFANVLNAMRKCSKIIIGKVQGKAVGGGVGLVAACDYAIATTNSSIKLSEIAIGIGPFVIEPAVSRKIGKTACSALTLTPTTWQTAEWAHQKGLFTTIVENQTELDHEVSIMAEQISNYNSKALAEIKKIFWENTDHWDTLLTDRAKISGQLVLSPFTKNALQQFTK